MKKRLLAGLLTALALSTAPALAGKANDTLTAAFGVQLPSLDPYYIGGNEGALLGRLVFDGLTYRDPVNFEIQPLLATSWKLVDDLTLDFEIRPGVTFQNGEPLTAEDVAYSLNYAADPKSAVFSPQSSSWIKKAEVTGPLKVRVSAKVPTPTALENLRAVYIVPAKYHAEKGKDGFGLAPIGTGPYTVQRGPANTVVLKRYQNYFTGAVKHKPKIGTLVYKTIPDVNTQIAELISGGVDWAWFVPDDQAALLKGMPNVKIVNAETRRVAFITMDAAGTVDPKSPLTDVRVRQAINHAIDRDAIAKNLVGGSAHRINAACTPTQLGCTDKVTHYNFDPAKAKALLGEAGYKSGFDIDVYGYRSQPVAAAIINYLSEVGIRANLRWMQYPAVVKARRERQTPLVIDDYSSGGSNDAGRGLGFFFNGAPDDQAKDADVNRAITGGLALMDDNARRESYEVAVRKIADQAYWAPLFTMPINFAMANGLQMPETRDESIEFWRAEWK